MFQTTINPNNRFFRTRSRILNWKFSLFILLAMILLVIPLSQNILLTYQSSFGMPLMCCHSVYFTNFIYLTKGQTSKRRSLTTRIFLALVPYSLYLFTLSLIPLPEGGQTDNLLTTALSRLVVLGTFIYGLLSGLGAARNSWEFLPSLNRRQ